MPKIPRPRFIDPFVDAALVVAILFVTACQQEAFPPQTASLQAEDLRNRAEERKEELIRQLANCESGGVGLSERPIYGGRGVYLGRLQFSTQTVIGYQLKKDNRRLSLREAAQVAHDYNRSAALAKYMIFDLEEPWHWPHCAKKISLRSEIAAVKELISQAQAADAKAKADDAASVETAETDSDNRKRNVSLGESCRRLPALGLWATC